LRRDLLHVGKALAVVVVIGAQMVFVVELARVAFVADGAVEEAHGGGEGVVFAGRHGGWFGGEGEVSGVDGELSEIDEDIVF
jgi:hypothetical protein